MLLSLSSVEPALSSKMYCLISQPQNSPFPLVNQFDPCNELVDNVSLTIRSSNALRTGITFIAFEKPTLIALTNPVSLDLTQFTAGQYKQLHMNMNHPLNAHRCMYTKIPHPNHIKKKYTLRTTHATRKTLQQISLTIVPSKQYFFFELYSYALVVFLP